MPPTLNLCELGILVIKEPGSRILRGLDPITISIGELLLNPWKNSSGCLILKVLFITRLGMDPTEPDIPMLVGRSLLIATTNFASSLPIFSMSCIKP